MLSVHANPQSLPRARFTGKNQDNENQSRNAVKFFDYKHFPTTFRTAEACLDTYNDLGFKNEIQWQFNPKSNSQKFTLECPFSIMCTARVDFKWSSKDQKYVRDDNNCHIFHDHCVQFRSIDHIDQDFIDLAAQIVLQNPKIAGYFKLNLSRNQGSIS